MTDRDRSLYRVVNYIIQMHVYRLPIDIRHLCEIYGAHWLAFGEYGVETAVDMIGNRDGAAIDLPGGKWGILYNEKAPETRLRFTLAEELMHRLLLHSQDDDFVFFRQTYTPETYAMYEAEAKRAAGMILVPPTVYYRFRSLYGIGQLARLCNVSEACAWTCAQDYEKNEEEIRENFTKKFIECDMSDLVKKNPLQPVAVKGESL